MSRRSLASAAAAALVVSTFSAFAVAGGGGGAAAAAPAAPAAAPQSDAAAVAAARAHLAAKASKYDLTGTDVKGLVVSSVVPVGNAAKVVHLQQTVSGIAVSQAVVSVTVDGGDVVRAVSSGVGGAAKLANDARPALTDLEAADAAASALDLDPTEGFRSNQSAVGADEERTISDGGISRSRIPTRLVYERDGQGSLRLAWELEIDQLDGEHWYQIRVDADSGDELDKNDFVAYDDYNVYPSPVEAPSFGSRSTVTNPATSAASPFGWHDTNGAAGAESTVTSGNNANAYVDGNNDNLPDAASQPSGGAGLSFNFPIDLAQDPSTYQPAAVTNLFYWNNRIHDILYAYGFNEASGNFQVNNYGEGGAGGDAVNAEAQDGGGLNNANFGTPPDGGAPRMQMYNWDQSSPRRDGDLDAGIIVHEYAHGISNRLTGGPAQAGCLANAEQAGEGWSDYYGYMLTMPNGTEPAGGRGIGTYALNQPTTGPGIRTQKYSTDTTINTFSYDEIATLVAPHGVGSVWAEMLWEMTYALIDEHGFSSDLVNGTAGNNISLQLVTDGLKLQPCSPGFVDARDAILAADQLNYGGENSCTIWSAFAKRGLGFSATQGSSASRTDGVEAYDMPPSCGFNLDLSASPEPVEAGDYIRYDFTVSNNDAAPRSNVTVTHELTGAAAIDFASGACVFNAGVKEGDPVRAAGFDDAGYFELGTMDAGAVYDCTFRARTSSSPFSDYVIQDGFEAGLGGWSTTHGPGTADWAVTSTTPSTGTKAAFSAHPTTVSDQYLTSNAVTLPAGSPKLTFANKYATESTFDGGVVEISADDGATWTDLGPRFTQNGYNATISTQYSSPIAGRQAFSGSSPGYVQSVADLTPYAGQTVRVRFRSATDSSDAGTGWWVDDVTLGEEVVVVNDATLDSTETDPTTRTVSTTVVEPVVTVPDAPTVASQVPQSSSTTKVEFTPGDDGGSPVTKYVVECRSTDGGATRSVGGTSSPRVVSGMTTGKTYRCRARAINAVGSSPFGAFGASFVQRSVPAAPAAPTQTLVNATTTSVGFAAPDDGGSPITGYEVRCNSSDGGGNKIKIGTSSPLVVTAMTTGRTYQCRVRATNAVGTGPFGPFAAPFVQSATTPAAPTVTGSAPTGATTARVSFALSENGGSPVTGYNVRCESPNGGVLRTKTGPVSPVVMTALDTGRSYQCRVRATNGVGSGPYSNFGPLFVQAAP